MQYVVILILLSAHNSKTTKTNNQPSQHTPTVCLLTTCAPTTNILILCRILPKKNFILWVFINITISWKGHCACPGQPPPPADISVCDYLFNYILSASCKLLNEQMCSRNINCCSSIILNIIAYFLCLSSSNCGTHPICISSLFLVYMKKLLGHFCQYFERDPFLLYSSC